MAEQHVFGVKVSLAGITDNEDMEKDARFLDELRKVFDSFETPTQFTSARQQIETAYKNAGGTLKKIINYISNYISVLVWEKSLEIVL